MNLNKGYVLVYDINNIKLHNYNTNDAIVDQVIILEKNNKLAIIESPAFYDNKKELEQYGTVKNIPLTSTGHVRRELKEEVQENWKYRNKVRKAVNIDGHIYNLLVECFAGRIRSRKLDFC